MKNLLLTIGVICFLTSTAQIPADSLQGHYKFDGAFTDISGNGNDILTGSGTYGYDRFGNPNSALYLNGASDSLALPISAFSPIASDFTFSFWYKTNSPEIMNLFSSKQSASDTTNNFEIQLNSNNSYYLEYLKQIFYQSFAYWNGSGLTNAIAEGNPGDFTNGEWSHFAITRQADSFSIYRNHSLYYLGINEYYAGTLGDAVDLIFSASPYYFKGAIDDLRLYNKCLTQSEIDLLWFENTPFYFPQIKSTDAYVQGSNVLVYWEYDTTQISDSIRVEYRLNNGDWIPSIHSNLAYENYTYINMSYAAGTKVEVRVSDYTNPTLTQTTGTFIVSEYDWVEAAPTLPFNPKDGSGLLAFDNKMWLLGGWDPPYHEPTYTHNEIWSSTDGSNWVFETFAPWPARHASGWLVGNDAMWVVGGDPQSGCLTDVWKSTDGINWVETNDAIPDFEMRICPNYAFLNNELFIFGGEVCSGYPLNDVWSSADGITWNQLPNAPWSGRGMQINSCVDGSGQLWMLGGSNESTRRSYNEVWKSADGITWTLVNESAPWKSRYWHTVAWYDNKMWLLGGMATSIEMNDAWYSEDGITWHELKSTTGNWPAGSRHAQSTTVFNNALWYMCGVSTNNAWKIINTQTVDVVSFHPSEVNFSIYPNPAIENISVSIALLPNEKNSIYIYNMLGVLIKEIATSTHFPNSVVQIDISSLQPGTYAMQINHETTLFVKQ